MDRRCGDLLSPTDFHKGCDHPRGARCFAILRPITTLCGEHDCASLTVGTHRITWKIDYHPQVGRQGVDPDVADPRTVRRIMTIMLAEEY